MAISRYATWLNSIIGSYLTSSGTTTTTGTEAAGKVNVAQSRQTTDLNRLAAPSTNRSSRSRSNSPSSNNNLSEESQDEELLRILTIVLADLLRLQLSVLDLFSTLSHQGFPKSRLDRTLKHQQKKIRD
ncbi:hypothetical protein KEM48_002669 [Puccinia striiformis f. sp. tritici PST-130]|nr:hypothetical protein KEM48_002669 [Puccinia striiformis f. sp. tritici PST-130]